MVSITIDTDICDACSSCVNACPMDVLVIDNDAVKPGQPELCMCCRLCEVECPTQAITVTEE